MRRALLSLAACVALICCVSCKRSLPPSPSTLAGTWVNETSGQTTILNLQTNGTQTATTKGSALGPIRVVVTLDLITGNNKWRVNGDSVSFTGGVATKCKISKLTSTKLVLESIVTFDGGGGTSIEFSRQIDE